MLEMKWLGPINTYLKHPGMNEKLSKAKIYSLERNALETLDLRFFLPS